MLTVDMIIKTAILVLVIAVVLWPKTQRKLDELDSKLIATDGKRRQLVDKIQYRWTGQPKGGHN